MTSRAGPPERDDGRDLAALLSAMANDHTPDRSRIMARVAAGRANRRTSAPRELSASWRNLRPVVLAASAVTAVSVGVAVGLSLTTPPGPSIVPQPVPPAARESASADGTAVDTATAAPTIAPFPPATMVPPTNLASPPTPPPRLSAEPPARPAGTSNPLPGGELPVGTVVASPDTVVLDADSFVDWTVVGSRADGRVITSKRGTGLDVIFTMSPRTPVVSPAPVSVLWSGGAPEQDRDRNSTWWTVPATPSAWSVDVTADDGGSVQLITGGTVEGGVVTVLVDGEAVGRLTWPTPASGEQGSAWLVTVPLTGYSPGTVVTVRVGSQDGGGDIGLGAVALLP